MNIMSPLLSPPAPPTSPSYPTQRQSTAPAAPKLRDSCHTCALSKVKCHKEKPKCSRCVKRGLKCEYVATKRGGRKHGSRHSNGDSGGNNSPVVDINGPQLLPLSTWFGPNSTIPTTDDLPLSGAINLHPGPSPSPSISGNSSNLFSNLLSTTDQSLSSVLTDLNTDLDNFFASPISLSGPDTAEAEVPSQADFFSTTVDGSIHNENANLLNHFPNFGDLDDSDFTAFQDSQCPPNSRGSLTSSHHHSPEDYSNHQTTRDENCGCLIMALSLMKQLFPNPSSDCTSSAGSIRGQDQSTSIPTIEAVIAKNEQTAEAVSGMLSCSCAQDGYLLAVMALIVFKLLGWYAAAARSMWQQVPSSSGGEDVEATSVMHDNDMQRSDAASHGLQAPSSFIPSHHYERVRQVPVVVGSYSLKGEDSGRMAAQLVLSELHRVQRLVNQLSSKLKAHVQTAKVNSSCGGVSLGDTPGGIHGSCAAENETTLPFSAVMLEQMANDLKRRLRSLSLEIVERLRTE